MLISCLPVYVPRYFQFVFSATSFNSLFISQIKRLRRRKGEKIMLEMKYIGEDTAHQVSFRNLSSHVCELAGDFPVQTAGFTLSRIGKDDHWDYSGYKTIYRQLENGVQFSNDGSIYVPPEPAPEPPEPEPPTLEEVQETKVAEMNAAMESAIAYGAEVQLSDGTTERFTLTDRDQISLIGLQVSAATLTDTQDVDPLTFPWHPADESVHCKFYSQEDMQKISSAGFQYVLYHVTYFRDLRIYIRSLTDTESVQAVTYGIALPEAYQSEPLKAMLAAQGV